MKYFIKYILFLLTFIVVAQANTPPLSSSYELKSYDYGARYYDPRTSVWQSPDPIIGEYMSGKRSMGGVYKTANLGLYTYTHNNPVKYIDPNGLEIGEVAVNKKVMEAIEMVRATPTGEKLWKKMEDNKAVINIRSHSGSASESNTGFYKKSNNSLNEMSKEEIKNGVQADTINVNVGTGAMSHRLAGVDEKDEFVAFVPSLARLVAHELGHTTGELDDGGSFYGLGDLFSSPRDNKYQMNNINKWETPIMNELGSKIQRTSYGAASGGKAIHTPLIPDVVDDKF